LKYVILGNGPAGVIAAETLRSADSAGEIVMIGCEREPPYSRMAIPYLLKGQIGEPGTWLRKSADHFDKLRVRRVEGRVTGLDAAARILTYADGSKENYDRLLIATGSHPIHLKIPGADLPQVQTCWTLEDARAIAARIRPGGRVVQLGAGFIGCIIMEAFHARDVHLTVVEKGDRMVPRMMTPIAGGMIKTWVEQQGIAVRTGAGIERIDPVMGPEPEKPSLLAHLFGAKAQPAVATDEVEVTLSTGETLRADLVIMSAGVRPNIEFLQGTPVKVEGGVIIDERMESSVRGIYAAGDVAAGPDFFTGESMVSAIQPNAADQARIAAINMAGGRTKLPGVLAINVLDSLGLISTSFGQWWGKEDKDGVELADADRFRYLSLQFDGDVLIGATSLGVTQHVGVLRGLIQNRTHLGEWKERLKQDPMRFQEAYLAVTHGTAASLVH
jgi:NADPH-dependent 2,4-dienoyl-CoA reductase/sulfur reductase-like enzyme